MSSHRTASWAHSTRGEGCIHGAIPTAASTAAAAAAVVSISLDFRQLVSLAFISRSSPTRSFPSDDEMARSETCPKGLSFSRAGIPTSKL